ncbi:MAG: aminopeptidase P family protein [Planctomycetes bacterium]|nr:aminopeptidase P family protein [Planctomycetota bacterium]
MRSDSPLAPLDRRTVLASGLGLAGLAGGCASTTAGARGAADADGELAELFSDLGDQSARWQPISAAEKRPRLARAAAALRAAQLDALLIEPGPTLGYLGDVGWGSSERLFALVVLADASCFWLVPAFEAARAEKRIAAAGPAGPLVTWEEHEYAWKPLAAALRARAVERIAIEPEARAFVAQNLAAALGAERVRSGVEVVRSLRGKKDPRELELLRGASELTQRAIRAVAERLRPGLSDHQLGRWVTFAQERLGLRETWCLPLLGPSAAYPHGEPEGRVLASGEGILVDTGGALHGYQSDITRSWSFGAPREAEFLRAWEAVRSAQRAAFERMAPGVACREIDRAARAAIEAAGYPGGYTVFGHRLGHGIGLSGHEEPYFDGGSETVLEPGMTFSDEPGVYLAGQLGVRLEDIVAITGGGAEVFGAWQESPDHP